MRAFRLAYDGTEYRGFQRQPHGETVEDALFDALLDLEVEFEDGSPVGYAAAGRTDAGVSARAQTVAFGAPAWLSPRALNGELPASVRAWAAADVPEPFHATHDAAARAYRYFLYAPEADDGLAEKAATELSGEHDFHNFTPDDEGTERALSVSVRRDGAFLVVDCRAGGFARRLVRRLVSVLDAVAAGKRPPEFIDRALAPAPLSGPRGIGSAAPEPLVLVDVRYPGVEFGVDDRALDAVREVFERRRRRRLAGARVAGELLAVEPSE
ncbi:tRNA pseudouridine(38-40) synthase TruA [Natronomonas sp. F2-12]|jgi:tRNA pseudouridine38-40 synthase|uniref:tRNA pseudouridine synthase A n=1 Tax=Natronomonas aquatica TaxID=2841590 RepID=A0A9R1D692_9EURY|nr:tRNA pseudouridine(38-40) synthase TruA [Natronomonas aquatica]MCQ4334001.1 tRNA pseudouridine(38-40) synthase TruA [Natronomonas aquatica]